MFVEIKLTHNRCPHRNGGNAKEGCPYHKWWGDFRLTPLCHNCVEGFTWEVKMKNGWGESWDAALGFQTLSQVWGKNPGLAEYIKAHLPAPKYIHGGGVILPQKGRIDIPAVRQRELSKNLFWWDPEIQN